MYKLTDLEKRILKECIFNGIPNRNKVIQNLRINAETFSYILKKLEQKNIIKEYFYCVDLNKLGLTQLAWIFLKFDRRFTPDVNEIIKAVFAKHQTQFACFTMGKFDLALKVFERDFTSLDKFKTELENELGESLFEAKTFFVSEVLKEHGVEFSKKQPKKILQKELMVLNEKLIFPKKSNREISKTLGLHRNTVSNLWTSLKEKKIVVKKIPIISQNTLEKIGFGFSVLILIRTVTGRQLVVKDQLIDSVKVVELFRLTSSPDILIHGRFSTISELNDFVTSFYSNTTISKNILNSESLITANASDYKRDFLGGFGFVK